MNCERKREIGTVRAKESERSILRDTEREDKRKSERKITNERNKALYSEGKRKKHIERA